MKVADIPFKAKEVKQLNIRVDKELWDEAQSHGIDVPQLFKNSLRSVLKQVKKEFHSCKTAFPRIKEAAESAINPIIPKRQKFKKY